MDFIDLNSGGVLYLRLYEQILSAAERGIIKKGERLPSIREAAAQLNVSRTTVENAYLKLCLEGVAEVKPQRGYFFHDVPQRSNEKNSIAEKEKKPLYDFSGRGIDSASADTQRWEKTVRAVLRDTTELTTYGDPQGEEGLRRALAEYAYKARGVRTRAENIVIGAGIGPLLCVLCGITGRSSAVAFEGSAFGQAQRIFDDYGIKSTALSCDSFGAVAEELYMSGADMLFLQPSALSKFGITGLAARRNEFAAWAKEKDGRTIIEDDYNGELRYTARSVTAFQGILPERTVYIGSFSKLLLPSVRIAYMVLPDKYAEEFRSRSGIYNQTCGKTEQLSLEKYIRDGALEKHLRKLRKLYFKKSQYLLNALDKNFPEVKTVLHETSATAGLQFDDPQNARQFCLAAQVCGVKTAESKSENEIRMCFTAIPEEHIETAVERLREAYDGLFRKI